MKMDWVKQQINFLKQEADDCQIIYRTRFIYHVNG